MGVKRTLGILELPWDEETLDYMHARSAWVGVGVGWGGKRGVALNKIDLSEQGH